MIYLKFIKLLYHEKSTYIKKIIQKQFKSYSGCRANGMLSCKLRRYQSMHLLGTITHRMPRVPLLPLKAIQYTKIKQGDLNNKIASFYFY